MALPSISGTLQSVAPVFVRKLRRRGDWGDEADDLTTRAINAVNKVFRTPPEPVISVYLVNCDEDLRRVALGINAGRDSLTEPVPFVAFPVAELYAVGIEIRETLGILPCAFANRLHRDLVATDEQLEKMCEAAMRNGRMVGNCSSGMMKEAREEALKEKCRTASKDDVCRVLSCCTT